MIQTTAIDLAHGGHQGLVKSKQLIRTKVWFPGIDEKMKKRIECCLLCQSTVDHDDTPAKMTPLPDEPWKSLSANIYGPLPTGEYLIVIIDDYSRFLIVEIVYSTSARVVILVLDKTFSIFGIPDELKIDNGPPFQASKFAYFAKHMVFKQCKVTPLWPWANGECQRFMRNLEKVVQGARTENKPWRREVYKFLRNYHATPHSTTGKSPAFALFGHERKIKFPITL